MKRTLSKEEFCDWYAKYRPNSFSYEGRIALFDMLESFEECTGEELEFDPIAFCCDFTEYEDMEEFWKKVLYHRENGIEEPVKRPRKKREIVRPVCEVISASEDETHFYD